ncbi:GntR family transcriptional regulator [Microbacterium sp.]|uniref:GntR family transcriptional regulator n=1 Tax=Microbacterium sp. TaxID=51671 RepID=UPI003A91EC29
MAQFEDAVERLRRGILDGQYQPGEKLSAATVADALGMSRTPVREAFRILSKEGLVEFSANRGARVAILDLSELESIFETRVALESTACRLAAEHVTDDDLDELQRLAEEIMTLSVANDEAGLALIERANSQFHTRIAEIAGSGALAAAMSGTVHAAILTRTRQAYDPQARLRSARHHLEIVEALRAGDGQWAQAVMTSHLLAARFALLGARRGGVDGSD